MIEGMEWMEAPDPGIVAGLGHIAYIRPAANGETGYAVCSQDGKQLALFPNYDAAFFTARQYNLDPVNVH